MSIEARCFLIPLLAPLLAATTFAQGRSQPAQPNAGRISLDVVVTSKSGAPVNGLQQQDFTVLDNNAGRAITSFQAVDGRQAPIEVLIVLDAVNTDSQSIAYERGEIEKFLRTDQGLLAHPTTFAVLTDGGPQMHDGFSTDGNALSALLDQQNIGLRTIRRDNGSFGELEQLQISLNGLHQLAARGVPDPVRRIILWISPGWPLLSGRNVQLSDKQKDQLFANIVNLSTQFLQSRITLYSIDPLGAADAGQSNTFYWKEFVKGVGKPAQVQAGNLGLEVLATQSGGVAFNSNNDVAGLLQRCLADLGTYYEIAFDAPSDNKPHEYHHLEVRIAKPGLTARTRQGYYSLP